MTAPSFQIDQADGAGTGVSGESRIDLWEGQTVTLSALNPPVGATFLWELLYAPPSSSAPLINPNAQVASITPDVNTESWRVSLTINSGGPGLSFVFILSCPNDNAGSPVNHSWRLPAVDEQGHEQNQGGNTRGWQPDYEKIIGDLMSISGGVTPWVTISAASPTLAQGSNTSYKFSSISNAISATVPLAPQNGDEMCLRWEEGPDNPVTINRVLSGTLIEDPYHPNSFPNSWDFRNVGDAFIWKYQSGRFQLKTGRRVTDQFIKVDNGTAGPVQLLPGQRLWGDVSGGALPTVNAPNPSGGVLSDGDRFGATNAAGDASATNIIITATGGWTIEDPNAAAGTFSATATIASKSASIDWLADVNNGRWKIV